LRRIVALFKRLPLQTKLILIGLVPTIFFLYVSLQYYRGEQQKLQLLRSDIRNINRSAGMDKLIDELRIERRYGYEFALKKVKDSKFIAQWKNTDAMISQQEKAHPELKNMAKYTLLDGLEKVRKNIAQKKLKPDAVMGYYTTAIFRLSYLDMVRQYLDVKKNPSVESVIAYMDTAFERINIDSDYNNLQWWRISGETTNQLKQLQLKLTTQANTNIIKLEAQERAKLDRLLVLLIVALIIIAAIVGYTINHIRTRLKGLKLAAEKIAAGNTGVEVENYSNDVIGVLATSVAKIDQNSGLLAEAANAIGKGDFAVTVQPRGKTDVLGNAILQMKNELERFTDENKSHAAELERLLTAVKQSETHFRQIADQAPLMIWQIDSKGDVVYVNRQWLDFTGLNFEDSMGKNWMQVLHPDELADRPFSIAFAERVTYRAKARFRNANNEYRWMYVQGNPIFNNNDFNGFIGSLTDITDQIEAQEAMMDLMHKKDEFLSIASHELRTPLTSIKTYSQLLVKNADPADKSYRFMTKTLDRVDKLEKLINDLLDVSSINAGRMVYNFEIIQFDELLKNSIESFGDISDQHQVLLQNVVTATLKVDRIRIEQVFNNLLNNAAKYSPNANTIVVDSRIQDGYVIVSVQDFGVGIAQKDCELLFERFYRSEKTSEQFQGLGLGLFISSEIIKRHNGRIWAESEQGKGTIVYFELPLYKEADEAPAAPVDEINQTG
jgi:PAS domain S-box-containing protein